MFYTSNLSKPPYNNPFNTTKTVFISDIEFCRILWQAKIGNLLAFAKFKGFKAYFAWHYELQVTNLTQATLTRKLMPN